MRFNSSMRHLVLASILTLASIGAASAADEAPAPPYSVVDGYKVDAKTLQGFRTWRAAACDRCHGANQEGLVGASLIDALKVLTQEEFKKTVTEGPNHPVTLRVPPLLKKGGE